jgi:hypothetical protein
VRPLSGLALLLVLALCGCAPGTPHEDSWRYDATRAVGDVASAVQTAQLALEQSRRDHLPHAYLQTVLVDAEKNGGMAAQKITSVQPPDVEIRRAGDVGDRLDQANGLLTDARIAVVAHDTGQYADLAAQLRKVAGNLQTLEAALEHPPEEAQ